MTKRKKPADSLAAGGAGAVVYPATKVHSGVVRADIESASPMHQSLEAAGELQDATHSFHAGSWHIRQSKRINVSKP